MTKVVLLRMVWKKAGKASLGFLNNTFKEKGDRDWLVDEDRLSKVELLLKQFLKGNDSIHTLTQFARKELKLRTVKRKRQGGALVTRSGIEHILKDPIYAGFFYSKDKFDNYRTLRTLDTDLPRLITFTEHEQIKTMLASKCHSKKQYHDATYTGLITGEDGGFIGADHKFQLICDCKHKFAYRSKSHCPKCGKNIDQLENPKYLSYTYYYNVQRSKKKKKAKCIEEQKVEQFILNYVQADIAMQPKLIDWSIEHLKYLELQQVEELKLKQQSKNDELALIEKKLSKLNELYYSDAISAQAYKKERNRFEQEVIELKAPQTSKTRSYEELINFLSVLSSIKEIFRNGSKEDKKRLLLQFGSNLIWDEENLLFLKPKWLLAYEKARKHTISKYNQFEPKNSVENKGLKGDFRTLCPSLLGYWDDVRTLKTKASNLFTSQNK